MKPVVGVMQAWSCIVVSVFAIVILTVIGALFQANHHSMVGTIEDPENGAAVAATVFSAVIVYAVRFPQDSIRCSLLAAGSRLTCTFAIIEEGRYRCHNETENGFEVYRG
ncbi:Uncharacterized protein LOCC1_G002580 [Lachnellula occidentalis]|uniref:Uncharacterized protein n=1 Tax=Lachnellula occidentalis TaxID=215460 RepID=A0A8H8S3G0_9HELO|nr:Uncharacterized protein LOCC1_G002580 [Lachnellula occidentalis]